MKLLIILSLAAICLAGHGKIDRKGFLFPGHPKPAKNSNKLVWNDYENIGSINPEKSSHAEKSSEESSPVLSNPNRRDVKYGRGFPGPAFHGPHKQVPSDDIKNKAIPSFVENNTPVLKKEESSSSSESHASEDKQGKSSSDESSKSSSSSSSEESAPNTIQEAPSNVDISEPADTQTEASTKEIKPSEENDKSKVYTNEEEPPMKLTFIPFVAAKGLGRQNRIRDVDTKRPEKAKRTRNPSHRPLRSADFNIQDYGIDLNTGGGKTVQGPQGGTKKKVQKHN